LLKRGKTITFEPSGLVERQSTSQNRPPNIIVEKIACWQDRSGYP
jgi:hypothetical protein